MTSQRSAVLQSARPAPEPGGPTPAARKAQAASYFEALAELPERSPERQQLRLRVIEMHVPNEADGVILYCDDREQMGMQYPLEPDDRAVLVSVSVLGLLLVPLAFGLARRVTGYERERQAMVRLAVGASSAERRRVAGELHDGVIQDLAGVGYALSAVDGQLAALGEPFTAAQIGDLRGRLRTPSGW